jgi:hypothetical protein
MTEIALSNQMKLQISAAEATLHPSARAGFRNAVMRALAAGPQPVNMNSVLMAIPISLSVIPASLTIISRNVGETNDEDDRRRRIY